MQTRDSLYIDGAWVATPGAGIEVIDAATEEVMGSVPAGTVADVGKAINAAAKAFPGWAATSIDERAKALARAAELLTERKREIAETITREVGMPIELSERIQAGLPITDVGSQAEIVKEFAWQETIGNVTVIKEPIGVVGAITPWNYPLHQVCAKVAPALAAGCTVVVKPAGLAPLSAFVLAEIFDEVGLPAGVFNLVTGAGAVIGEAIATHPAVDMVSFTGSTKAGSRVMHLGAETVKKVALELGGKSATVLLDDADFDNAVARGIAGCFQNSGQTCSAVTRMVVPRAKLAHVEELAAAVAATFVTGDPFDPATKLGPVVSAGQRDSIRDYINAGIKAGAKLIAGGPEAPKGLEKGYFVQGTVFSEVTNDMTIAQEEIFGPVMVIIAYDSEAEAIRIANDSPYGLSGAVWSGDPERAERVARRMRTGQVSINGGLFNPLAPFGGYKQSGIGRELGRFGLEEFLEVTSLQH